MWCALTLFQLITPNTHCIRCVVWLVWRLNLDEFAVFEPSLHTLTASGLRRHTLRHL